MEKLQVVVLLAATRSECAPTDYFEAGERRRLAQQTFPGFHNQNKNVSPSFWSYMERASYSVSASLENINWLKRAVESTAAAWMYGSYCVISVKYGISTITFLIWSKRCRVEVTVTLNLYFLSSQYCSTVMLYGIETSLWSVRMAVIFPYFSDVIHWWWNVLPAVVSSHTFYRSPVCQSAGVRVYDPWSRCNSCSLVQTKLHYNESVY